MNRTKAILLWALIWLCAFIMPVLIFEILVIKIESKVAKFR